MHAAYLLLISILFTIALGARLKNVEVPNCTQHHTVVGASNSFEITVKLGEIFCFTVTDDVDDKFYWNPPLYTHDSIEFLMRQRVRQINGLRKYCYHFRAKAKVGSPKITLSYSYYSTRFKDINVTVYIV